MNFQGVPILMYHSILDNPHDLNCVSPNNFMAQMNYLKKAGYQTITFDDLEKLPSKLPAKSVILTFDDGFRDNYTTVFPILKQFGFKATIFLISGCLGLPINFTLEMVQEMLASKLISFGAHTITHANLPSLPDEEQRKQIFESKRDLEALLGCQISTFCYPYGNYNNRTLKYVKEAGYRFGITTHGGFADLAQTRYELPRIAIINAFSIEQYSSILNSPFKPNKLNGDQLLWEKATIDSQPRLFFTGDTLITKQSIFDSIVNSFTYEFWVKPEATITINQPSIEGASGLRGQRYAIAAGHGEGDDSAGVGVSVGSNGISVYEHDHNYLTPLLTYQCPIYDWVHVAVVYKNKTPSLYINGSFVKEGLTSPKNRVYPSGILGGLRPYGSFVGYLKDVLIWSYSKEQQQIVADIAKPPVGNEVGLLAYWKLDKGINNFAHDSSENLLHATIENGSWRETPVLGQPQLIDQGQFPSPTKGIKNFVSRGAQESNMIVCTSLCANYLPKARVLAKSLKKHNPRAKLVACLVEDELPVDPTLWIYFADIVLAKDLGIPNFNSFIFKHDKMEASTVVKGQLFKYLLNLYPSDSTFVYLDPDVYVGGAFDELLAALRSNSIILTPHLIHPENTPAAVLRNELDALKHGAYNLGFLAIKRSKEAQEFINWWTDRTQMACYKDIRNGIFTDQKWIDLAPGFFNIHLLKHAGYNVAPWNLSQRKITKTRDGTLLVNGEALRFFHFSGFDSRALMGMLQEFVPDQSDPVYTLLKQYQAELEVLGHHYLGKLPWSYDYFISGEPITTASRQCYRRNPRLQARCPNPFTHTNHFFQACES